MTPIALHEFDSLKTHRALLLAGCTGRGGGVSEGPYASLNLGLHVGDDPRAVVENRRRVAQVLGTELSAFAVGQQVHGREVRIVTAADRGRGALTADDALPDTDALITRERGIVLAVLLADCVPVILFDPLTPAIGVVHAGWKGTVAHIARNAVLRMQREFGSDPGSLLAAIGPSIGPASYEVSAEVAERARAEFPGEGGKGGEGIVRPYGSGHTPGNDKHLLDLWGANAADLLAVGLLHERIEVAGLDTFQCSGQFFSHRRQQPTGRFMALATLRE